MNGTNKARFSDKSLYYTIVLMLLLVGGFLVRLIDLKDPPLDYHPTRQLRAAIISRSIFLKINPDADPEIADYATDPMLYDYVTRREPPVTETVVALIYLIMGREVLWVSRIVTAVFWCLGGVGLYLLVKRLTTRDAGLISLGFYLFNPFGVIGSRSFQPESLMVACMIWALLLFLIWLEKHSWKFTILTGLMLGFTIFVKPNPLFILVPVFGILLLSSYPLKNLVKNPQIWTIIGLSLVLPVIYYFIINPAAGGFLDNFWLDIKSIIPTRRYFMGWGSIITDIIPFAVLILALTGILLFDKQARLLGIGMWIGYIILGIFVPHHIYTHNYYSIILVPMTAICLAQVAQIIAERASQKRWVWKVLLVGLALIALAYPTWNVYKDLHEKDYRGEPGGWEKVAEALPQDQRVIALTHNYGYNLAYFGHRMVANWPYVGDLNLQAVRGINGAEDFDAFFDGMTDSFDLFLVTHFGELNAQSQLMEKLSELPVYSEGDGYMLYDLSPQ